MRRFILITILAIAYCLPFQAQNINVDKETLAAMEIAFQTNSLIESQHNQNLLKIRQSYKGAEVAAAGIYFVKHLDRKALTNVNIWSSDENYYYKRIYNIVSRGIIPKTIDVAKLMVKDPSTAIYWGSYLVKTTQDVKSLCQQFESVVTNGKLSFKDLPFLEIADQFKQVFDITKLGEVDWKTTFEAISDDIKNSFTKENFMADIEKLVVKGAALAASGFNSNLNKLLQGTSFGGTFQDKIGDIITLAGNANDMFSNMKDKSALEIVNQFAGKDNIEDLFDLSDYNTTQWADDFTSAANGQFYTQRVYIYREEKSTDLICNYKAPTDQSSVLKSDHWYRFFPKKSENFFPNASQQEDILRNSENQAGWSRKKVEQLNQENIGKGYRYEFFKNLNEKVIEIKDPIISRIFITKAYAYDIQVYKYTDIKEVVYEEIFDSYKMDWNTFMAMMNARLEQYNLNGDHTDISNPDDLNNPEPEKNYTYKIGYDERKYYEATTDRDIQGASSATFLVTCSDGGVLGKGSTSYKCRSCGKTVNDHTRQCAMKTTLGNETEITENIAELKKQAESMRSEAKVLQKELDELNKEYDQIRRKLNSATTTEERDKYREQLNKIQETIKEKQLKYDGLRHSITSVEQAIIEAEEGEQVQTDDYNRIPQIMKSMKSAYEIAWSEEGHWEGDSFIRKGTMGGKDFSDVTFKATVKIARKPKYFLGIKIHRAIVQIDWELTSSWSETTIAEEMDLDPNRPEAENSKLVNDKLSQLAQQHPNCEVTVELYKTPEVEKDDTPDVKHLLWASDRLDIARDIEARLSDIHTQLVLIEKFLHYKYTVKDWFLSFIPKLNADKDRKLNIAEQCHKRWMITGGVKPDAATTQIQN